MTSERYKDGEKNRREVLGDAYVNKAAGSPDSFNKEFQQLVTEYAWGEIWGRDAVTRKQKSLNTLCILATLNRSTEFQTHLRGAINNGCTVDEIKETLMQVAVYAGMPAGVQAFRLATEVLQELGILEA